MKSIKKWVIAIPHYTDNHIWIFHVLKLMCKSIAFKSYTTITILKSNYVPFTPAK